jgi:FixJ family two-component response regulator
MYARHDLHIGVIGVFREIRNAFKGQKTRKENDTPEGQQFRKDLHTLVNKAREVMQGVVLESLEKCKAHK